MVVAFFIAVLYSLRRFIAYWVNRDRWLRIQSWQKNEE